MCFKNLFLCLKKTYIIFFATVLFLNFTTSDLKSSIFSVNDIEIIEPFEANFKKNDVIDKAFKQAFKKLSCLHAGEIYSCETLTTHRYF